MGVHLERKVGLRSNVAQLVLELCTESVGLVPLICSVREKVSKIRRGASRPRSLLWLMRPLSTIIYSMCNEKHAKSVLIFRIFTILNKNDEF